MLTKAMHNIFYLANVVNFVLLKDLRKLHGHIIETSGFDVTGSILEGI